MKMTSGARKRARQERALERLERATFMGSRDLRRANLEPPAYTDAEMEQRKATWEVRRQREIEILKKRTGRLFT